MKKEPEHKAKTTPKELSTKQKKSKEKRNNQWG